MVGNFSPPRVIVVQCLQAEREGLPREIGSSGGRYRCRRRRRHRSSARHPPVPVVFVFVFVFVVVAMITEEASDGPGEEEGCHVL